MWRHSCCFPFALFTDWVFSCCESEITLNHACLIILSYIAVYNRDIYAHVSSTSVSNVGLLFVMLKIKQHLSLEVAMRKFFKVYGKYRDVHSANSINAVEHDSANHGHAAKMTGPIGNFQFVEPCVLDTHQKHLTGSVLVSWHYFQGQHWILIVKFVSKLAHLQPISWINQWILTTLA